MNLDELLKPPPEGCLCPFDMTRCEVHPWEERVKWMAVEDDLNYFIEQGGLEGPNG